MKSILWQISACAIALACLTGCPLLYQERPTFAEGKTSQIKINEIPKQISADVAKRWPAAKITKAELTVSKPQMDEIYALTLTLKSGKSIEVLYGKNDNEFSLYRVSDKP